MSRVVTSHLSSFYFGLLTGISGGNISVGLLVLNCQHAVKDLEVSGVAAFAQNLRGSPFCGIIVLCRHDHRY